MMRLTLAISLLLCAFQQEPPKEPEKKQEPNEAEQLFRKMEEKLRQAKTVQFQFKSRIEGETPAGIEGIFLLSKENKVCWRTVLNLPEEKGEVLLISNGTRMRYAYSDLGEDPDCATPRNLGACVVLFLTRVGILAGRNALRLSEEADAMEPEDRYPVSAFALGRREGAEGRELQEITFTLEMSGGSGKTSVSLWVDGKTHLPVRRVVRAPAPGMTFSEEYTDLRLDEKIDDKNFELVRVIESPRDGKK